MALAVPDAMVLELMTMGQQSAAHLGVLLRSASPSSPYPQLAAEILRCCGRVIAALTAANNGSSGGTKKRKAAVDHETKAAAACSPPSTPQRKRSRGGAEALGVVTRGTTMDGFIWRKYGQKEINGRKHPRLYYRCAYSHQGCTATRRVQQQEDEQPAAAYEIAYYGKHSCIGAATCHGAAAAALPPPTVVDFGSNNTCGSPAASEQLWSWDGQTTSQGGWSSAASSEVVGFEFAQTADEWRHTARVEVPPSSSGATPSDPVTEFLDGCFDWESVLNDTPFDFGTLLP